MAYGLKESSCDPLTEKTIVFDIRYIIHILHKSVIHIESL